MYHLKIVPERTGDSKGEKAPDWPQKLTEIFWLDVKIHNIGRHNLKCPYVMFVIIAALIILFIFLLIPKNPRRRAEYLSSVPSEKILQLPVAGARHYSGEVKSGDYVEFVHDPYNKYDKNAVEVLNLKGHQIGFIPKNSNRKVLQLMDEHILFGIVLSSYYRGAGVEVEIRRMK